MSAPVMEKRGPGRPPKAAVPVGPRSERGRRKYAERVLEPIDQIRVQPGGVTGAWAYYLRPEGATIRDALILYPNGGRPSPQDDPKGKFGTNAELYQARQARKGFTYLGQRLDQRAVRLLVETIARNRDDEILYTEDEIAECERIRKSDAPQREREIAAKRLAQWRNRLEYLTQPWDPDALVAELDEIARAQRLANIDPNVLAVMREMVGEVNAKTEAAVARFSRGKTSESELSPASPVRTTRKRGVGTEFSGAVDFIDDD